MKRQILIVLVSLLSFVAQAQVETIRTNGVVTAVDVHLKAGKSLNIPVWADTATATTNIGLDKIGKMFWNKTNSILYVRDTSVGTHKWAAITGGGGGGGITDTTALMRKANNLADILSASAARGNLGLGTAAVKNAPTSGDATGTDLVNAGDSRLAAVAGKKNSTDSVGDTGYRSVGSANKTRDSLGALIVARIINAGGVPSFKSGIYASRPSATGSGLVYISTDSGRMDYDLSTGNWVRLGGGSSGGGGSQDLASVTALGNTTTKALITSDTSQARNAYIKGNVTAGENPIPVGAKAYFFGDSWVVGQASSTHDSSFAARIARMLGRIEDNRGHSGWTMGSQGLGSSFYEQVIAGGAIPTPGPGDIAFIEYSVNDAVFSIDTATVFKPQYGIVLDSFTNRTWTNKNLFLITTGHTPTSSVGTRLPNYVSAAKSVAATKGFQIMDMRAYMLAHGGDALLKSTDLLHQNDTGHAVYAQGVMTSFLPLVAPGGIVDARASVYAGLDVTAGRNLSVAGTSSFTGDESHLGYQKATAANGYFARFQNAHLSSSGQYGEMRFVFLGSDGFSDSSWIKHYTNGGHSELGLGYMTSTRIRFPYNAGVNINSATGDGTNTNYINGSTGINGAVTVTGNTTVTGQLFITGGSSINPKQLNFFNSGNVNYGLGVQAGGNMQIYSGNGGVSLGNMSTSDGTTYIERFNVGRTGTTYLASGNVMVIGGTSDNGKGILQVLGKTYLGNSSTDTVALFARASYSTNLGSTFTTNSLVNRGYVDSADAVVLAAIGGYKYVQTADASAITNTTTPASITSTGVGSLTIAANAFTAGKVLKIHIDGIVSTDATNPQFTVGSTLFGSAVSFGSFSQASLSGAPYSIDVTGICRSTGSSAVLQLYETAIVNNTPYSFALGTITFNSTTSNSISSNAYWTTASTNNSITNRGFIVELR